MVARMLVVAAVALSLAACRDGGERDATATAVTPTTHLTPPTTTASIPSPTGVIASPAVSILATPGLPVSEPATPTMLSGTPTPGGATLNARQAQEVAALTAFLAAYNAGDLDATLAAIAEPWGWSDCDYARGTAMTGQGRDAFAAWLRQRFADHDQLIIGQVILGGQDGLVMGVSFARRTSDTLRAQGLPDGIAPQLGAKVFFDYSDPHNAQPRGQMTAFNNGPFGGSPESCEPATYRR